ncbi:hypothetical protein SMU80_09760 [Streptococcus mutans SF1]|nr:hypothetical protein SMU80_09760 [Streptococcus mutans SF1]EMC41097.1 hypothetical protein SMU97_09609 [Streptococcus mutans SM4]
MYLHPEEFTEAYYGPGPLARPFLQRALLFPYFQTYYGI